MAGRPRVALAYRCEDRDAGDLFYRVVPSGLLCLHGFLRRSGADSRLFNFSGRPWRVVGRALADFAPAVVGVSHFTYNHAASARLYREARRACSRALVAAGGAQATFLDAELLARCPELDLVVRGEGEAIFAEVVRRAAAGRPAWADVPGLTWRAGQEIRRSVDAPLLEDLDPVYGLERFAALDGVTPEEQFPFVVTTRGCPARCNFCSSPALWGCRVRARGVANVMAEVRLLRERFGIDYLGIRDDTFTADPARVRAVCRALAEEEQGFLWNCQSRVTLVDEELLLEMKQAGCEQVQFGIESASPAVQRRLNKPIPPARIQAALAACRRAGILSSAYFITGVPGQTEADLEADRDLFRRHGLQDGIVSPLCHYPGTALFAAAERAGEAGREIFFRNRPEALFVRADAAANRQYHAQVAFIERWGPRNAFTRAEIEGYLERTGRCAGALLDLGRHWLAVRRPDRARPCFEEILRRWPDHPWGLKALRNLPPSRRR
jgi:anaerobic magnesium-protoporphyrin IX monomethyl ester cyclase